MLGQAKMFGKVDRIGSSRVDLQNLVADYGPGFFRLVPANINNYWCRSN